MEETSAGPGGFVDPVLVNGCQPHREGLDVDGRHLALRSVRSDHCGLHNGCPRLPFELGELAGIVQTNGLDQGAEDDVGFAVDLHGLNVGAMEGDGGNLDRD